jgi:type 1 fimbria pilin
MARGVGIQLLQGDLATGLPLSLGEILEGPIASFESAVKIPLAARYYRDVPAEEVVPGRISIAATFTLYYQ